VLSQPTSHLAAVHPGHFTVQEDNVRHEGNSGLNGRQPIVNNRDLVAPEPQQDGEAGGGVG
jgi:hypothetical protein